jgi:hypothetical protein
VEKQSNKTLPQPLGECKN